MRESSKSALGGVLAALSVSMMLLTYLSPFMVYASPAIAGLFVLILQYEAGRGWAFGEYAAVGLLSMILVADKEAAVFYVCLFGLYPILQDIINHYIRLRVLRILIKFVVVNASLLLSFVLCLFVFGVTYDDLFERGKVFVVLFLLGMDFLLFLYDFLVRRLQDVYVRKLRKKLLRLFK